MLQEFPLFQCRMKLPSLALVQPPQKKIDLEFDISKKLQRSATLRSLQRKSNSMW